MKVRKSFFSDFMILNNKNSRVHMGLSSNSVRNDSEPGGRSIKTIRGQCQNLLGKMKLSPKVLKACDERKSPYPSQYNICSYVH